MYKTLNSLTPTSQILSSISLSMMAHIRSTVNACLLNSFHYDKYFLIFFERSSNSTNFLYMPSSLLIWCKQTARYFFGNVGFIWDQQRTAAGVCNSGDSQAWQKKESSYREEEKVGRVIMNRVLDFSLTEFLPGTKRSLIVELCCGLRAWQLLDPGLQILFNLKKFFTAQNALFHQSDTGKLPLSLLPTVLPISLLQKPRELSLFIWL